MAQLNNAPTHSSCFSCHGLGRDKLVSMARASTSPKREAVHLAEEWVQNTTVQLVRLRGDHVSAFHARNDRILRFHSAVSSIT